MTIGTTTVLCRTADASLLGEFENGLDLDLARGNRCVVGTDRGTELADVLRGPAPVERWEDRQRTIGNVLRAASPDDLERAAARETEGLELFRAARRSLRRRDLPGRLLTAWVALARERAILYFEADGSGEALRTEAHGELIEDLAADRELPVELRLVGSGALVDASGGCGRPGCPRGEDS